jgi:hypothetical protein
VGRNCCDRRYLLLVGVKKSVEGATGEGTPLMWSRDELDDPYALD